MVGHDCVGTVPQSFLMQIAGCTPEVAVSANIHCMYGMEPHAGMW